MQLLWTTTHQDIVELVDVPSVANLRRTHTTHDVILIAGNLFARDNTQDKPGRLEAFPQSGALSGIIKNNQPGGKFRIPCVCVDCSKLFRGIAN